MRGKTRNGGSVLPGTDKDGVRDAHRDPVRDPYKTGDDSPHLNVGGVKVQDFKTGDPGVLHE